MRINSEQALQRLFGSDGSRKAPSRVPITLIDTIKRSGKERLYAFQRANTMLIAPADDTLQPVVAEFEMGDGIINPAAQLLIDDYAREVKKMQDIGGDGNAWQVPTVEPGIYVAPMMPEILWHQHEPFNDGLVFVEYKPTDGIEEKCIVGCPAIAVSMLLYHWYKQGRPRGCQATPAYTSKTIHGYRFRVPKEGARASFDFDHMLDIYTKRKGAKYVDIVSYTEEQAKAVADLCAHVGKAIRSYFSPVGSGQFPAPVADAIEHKLHLGKVTLLNQPTAADQYDTTYLDMVRESLEKNIPVLVCGYTGKTANASGHWFIVDGYRPSDDTYHINWGWGKGYNNGWFKMSRLSYLNKDDSYNFAFKKTFVVWDNAPSLLYDVNGDGRINISDVTKVINTSISGENEPQCDVNYDGKVDKEDAQAIIDTILGKGNP